MNKIVNIYTDGACSGNPGPGGWAAILFYKGFQKEIAGAQMDTTNNRMELTAALKALECLKEPCDVELYTDSAYLCNAFVQRWVDNWQKNGWRTSKKEPVENQDIWEQLIAQTHKHRITWRKVKGHSDNEHNNRCDVLARAAIKDMLAQ